MTQALVAGAQEALAAGWEHPVRLRIQDTIRSWGRHTLLSCRVKDGPPAAPDFVVVKATNQPDGDMRTERAGLELLAETPELRQLGPVLYAASGDERLLVLEDVGGGPTLSQLLRSKPAWAREALIESMTALAAVHAYTRGLAGRFARLRDRSGGPGAPGPEPFPTGIRELTDPLAAAYQALGWEPDLPTAELREISARMQPPEPERCLTFFDQCPPNRIVTDRRLRIVDLEMVGFRHPLLDGAYPLLGHLTCMDGQRFPAELAAELLATYRTGLAAGYPELVDDARFGPDLAAACAVWLVRFLRSLPDALVRDRVVGFRLVRSRQRLLAVLDAFLGAAGSLGALPRLAGVCRRIRDRLATDWAGQVEPLPYFPVGTGTAKPRLVG